MRCSYYITPKTPFRPVQGRVPGPRFAQQRSHTGADGLPEGPVCCHSIHSNAFRSNVQVVSSRNRATDCFPALRSHARATKRAETWSPGPLRVAKTHQ
jgi:hypothetical protein